MSALSALAILSANFETARFDLAETFLIPRDLRGLCGHEDRESRKHRNKQLITNSGGETAELMGGLLDAS